MIESPLRWSAIVCGSESRSSSRRQVRDPRAVREAEAAAVGAIVGDLLDSRYRTGAQERDQLVRLERPAVRQAQSDAVASPRLASPPQLAGGAGENLAHRVVE